MERVILERHLWHLLQQLEIGLGDGVLERCLHRLLADVGDVVHVVRATVDAVGDEQVLAPIVVEIGEEGRPAPVRRLDTRQHANLAEAPLAAIELEVVARELRVVTGLESHVVERV